MLMVDSAYAGQGIGRCLLRSAEDRIASSGRRLVRLDCARRNPRLRGFYARVGYRIVGYKVIERAAGTALYEKTLAR